jgi:phage-related protein
LITFIDDHLLALTNDGMKTKICLVERKNYYAIKCDCGDRWNLGLLEKATGALADNNGKRGSLGALIEAYGGSIRRCGRKFTKSADGSSMTCGGTTYLGWVDFGCQASALAYLEKYFSIRYC